MQRGITDKLSHQPDRVIADLIPNPKQSDIEKLAALVPNADVIVSLGGGSVIDATKAALVVWGLGDRGTEILNSHLREGTPLPEHIQLPEFIAVPTTSGSGSEVTRWGTIWGDDKIKFSVNDPRLYPTYAILDPNLTVSMPRDLTLFSAMDALSHAMEAVWNKHHTPITDTLAESVIKIIRDTLLSTLENGQDIESRILLQKASTLAGLAIGATQSALAHSISYPFTARCGVPHGLACSFTLGQVARYNLEEEPTRLRPIANGLGCKLEEIPETIEQWFRTLGVGSCLARYVDSSIINEFDNHLITRSRAANNIRSVDEKTALEITRDALVQILNGN
jgi:alcohol dehydrogenase